MWKCELGSSGSGLSLVAECSKHDLSNLPEPTTVTMMELAGSSETWQQVCHTTRCKNLKYHNLNTACRGNVKTCTVIVFGVP